MKNIFMMLFLMTAGAAAAETRTYDFTEFTKVEVSDGVSAAVTVGGDFLVQAEAIRGDLDRLNLDQVGDIIRVSRKNRWGLFSSGNRDRFEVTIVLPELTEVDSSAGASVDVAGAGDNLSKARASSGSTLKLEAALLDSIDLSASSGATLRASGSCSFIKGRSSSGSSLLAGDLECETADLDSSSGSSLRAYASRSAVLEASSGASLTLSGAATITEQKVSSGASISVR